MGTVGSYTGGGGTDGDDLRQDLTDWLDRLAAPSTSEGDGGEPPGDGEGEGDGLGDRGQGPRSGGRPHLDPNALLAAVGLLRPRGRRGGGSDGPGGGGGGGARTGGGAGRRGSGGASRSAAASAGTAGRAAAGAYAFATGDTETLARLGLAYDDLRALDDNFEVVRQIVNAAFESAPSDSTIPDHEQRLVAADIAEWLIEESAAGQTPTPEEIVRMTIGAIIAQATLAETGDVAGHHANGASSEEEIREAADVLASQAELSVDGATEEEFARAIEDGIETLRAIKEAAEK
jgi:hypothetical protein